MVKVSLELCLDLMAYSREFGQLTKTEELSEEAQGALELLVQAHESGADFLTLADLYDEFAGMVNGRLDLIANNIAYLLGRINDQIKTTSNETI